MKSAFWLVALSCLLSVTWALAPNSGKSRARPGFDPKDIVHRIMSGPQTSGLDQGEFLIDTSITIGSASNDQMQPAIAFDGTNFLVVWEDWRSEEPDIYGARVTPQGAVLDTSGIPVSRAANDQMYPAAVFVDGNSFVVWQDYRSAAHADIYGAWVSPAGVVIDSGPVVRQEGHQQYPALARGTGNQIFLAYQGWTGMVAGKTYNAYRIWGKMNPSTAVAEMTNDAVRMANGATIVRSTLFLSGAAARHSTFALLNSAGRKVLELVPGANDVRQLPTGVYFVQSADSAQCRAKKIVIAR